MNTSSTRFNVPTRSRISITRVVVWMVIPSLWACLLVWGGFQLFGGK